MTKENIKDYLNLSAEAKINTAAQCAEDAAYAASIIAEKLKNDGTLFLCGNGGSAGDAQHIAAEFMATLDSNRPRQGLKAIALTTDTSFITAYSNDFSFDDIFARQIKTLATENDVIIAISTSGNSKNILKAVQAAQIIGASIITMTGEDGGSIAPIANVAIKVPSKRTSFIQECHIAIGHAITAEVEKIIV